MTKKTIILTYIPPKSRLQIRAVISISRGLISAILFYSRYRINSDPGVRVCVFILFHRKGFFRKKGCLGHT